MIDYRALTGALRRKRHGVSEVRGPGETNIPGAGPGVRASAEEGLELLE